MAEHFVYTEEAEVRFLQGPFFKMKKKVKKEISWKLYLRIFLLAIILYTFYKLGFPLYFIILIGIVILLLILLRGTLYKKLDDFLIGKFPSLSKQKPWVRKLIVILAFILIYILLKQIIFLILKQFGIDVQQMITESINSSINNG